MPKLAVPLTDVQIRNAKPRDKPYVLSDGDGLFVEVMPSGSKFWRWRYRRTDGTGNRMTFGRYPETTLQAAREKRLQVRRLLQEGTDPAAHRDEMRRLAVERAANTFEKVAREWHRTKHDTWQEQTAKNILHRLEMDIFPEIGAIPIDQVTHAQMIAALRKIESRGAREVAHRLRANCSQVFRFAIASGLRCHDIAGEVQGTLKPVMKGHFAAIDADQLPDFLAAFRRNDACMSAVTRIAVNLMMLLFVRTSELLQTPWDEVKFNAEGDWIIPWQRMKRGRRRVNPDKTDHCVPMPRQARALLEELRGITGGSKYLFPSTRDSNRVMSDNTILKALERMGYKGDMTGHGFRTLAMSTLKERLGYRHEVVDRQLAHAPKDKLMAAYDRALFLKERREMMQAWADYLDRMG